MTGGMRKSEVPENFMLVTLLPRQRRRPIDNIKILSTSQNVKYQMEEITQWPPVTVVAVIITARTIYQVFISRPRHTTAIIILPLHTGLQIILQRERDRGVLISL